MDLIDFISSLIFLSNGWDFRISASPQWKGMLITLNGVPPDKRKVLAQIIKNYLGEREATIAFEPAEPSKKKMPPMPFPST